MIVSDFGIGKGLEYHTDQLKPYLRPSQQNWHTFLEQLESSVESYKAPSIIGALEYLIADLSEDSAEGLFD